MDTCRFRSSCSYFMDLKERRPVTLESVKREFCDNRYSRCARFMIYAADGEYHISRYLVS